VQEKGYYELTNKCELCVEYVKEVTEDARGKSIKKYGVRSYDFS